MLRKVVDTAAWVREKYREAGNKSLKVLGWPCIRLMKKDAAKESRAEMKVKMWRNYLRFHKLYFLWLLFIVLPLAWHSVVFKNLRVRWTYMGKFLKVSIPGIMHMMGEKWVLYFFSYFPTKGFSDEDSRGTFLSLSIPFFISFVLFWLKFLLNLWRRGFLHLMSWHHLEYPEREAIIVDSLKIVLL